MANPKYNLDELYPDDPPRRATPVVIYHEFRAPVTNRPAGENLTRAGMRTGRGARIHSAWLSLQILLMVLGGVVSIAYVAALPRILQIAAIAVAVVTYSLLYAMIRNLRSRQ